MHSDFTILWNHKEKVYLFKKLTCLGVCKKKKKTRHMGVPLKLIQFSPWVCNTLGNSFPVINIWMIVVVVCCEECRFWSQFAGAQIAIKLFKDFEKVIH